MRRLLLIACLFTSLFAFCQSKIDTLKNETIIKLSKSKLPESVISQKIEQSFCRFDVGIEALITLKENNVSDNVINLMISKQGKADSEATFAKQNNSTGDYTFTQSGIYFVKDKQYLSLDPTIVSSSNGKANLVGTIKYRSQIEGAEANYQLAERRPQFFFNFEPVKKSLNAANANSTTTDNYLDQIFNKATNANGTYTAVSPNDFKLIKLDRSKNRREFVSGKISTFGGMDMSIDDKHIVNFKYEKVSSHTYKLRFEKDLSPGEYCFVYLGNNNNAAFIQWLGQNNFKVFDFSITK